MICIVRDRIRNFRSSQNLLNQLSSITRYPFYNSSNSSYANDERLKSLILFSHPSNTVYQCTLLHFSPYFSSSSQQLENPRTPPRKKRYGKSNKSKENPVNIAEFERCVSQLSPRFTSEDLYKILILQEDPYVCMELFKYASQQPRFKHDISTYHIIIKKLGSAKLYEEMDKVVDQVLSVSVICSEALFNSIIYFYTEDRKLSKAVNVYKHMRKSKDPGCRPSVRTYNLLFTSFLSQRSNSYINHMYMETIRCLFRQMVNDGMEPDIFSLNSMIKGYILSLHVNDALRIFHQMGAVYKCHPNSHSYDYLIHGLCCQGRTNNAKELYREMKNKGFVPSAKAFNSLTNSLAIGGEVEEAVRILWEMNERRRSADFITYKTVLDEICRQGKVGDAMRLLKELQEKDLVDGPAYRKLLHVIEDEFGELHDR